MQAKTIWAVIVIVLVILGGWRVGNKPNTTSDKTIKVGVVTDLSGPAAYWGESTRIGAEVAKKELAQSGIHVSILYEDYQLNPAKAVSATQKLIDVDKVDAIYTEFNPGAVASASYLNGKGKLFVYNAAVVSPVLENKYTFKTYLDYEIGCKKVAEKFKDDGLSKIGVLKVNLEFGDLCLQGIQQVYSPDKIIIETYNLGAVDFRTQILKISKGGASAVINVGFEGEIYNTLKILKEGRYILRFGTVDDTITDKVKNDFTTILTGAYSFGFADVNSSFLEKIKDNNLSTYYGAAIAYSHITQIALALHKCSADIICQVKEMESSPADNTIGFTGFVDRIANFDMKIKNY